MIGESEPTIYGEHKYWKVKVKVKRGRLQREESTGRGKSAIRSSYDLFTMYAVISVFMSYGRSFLGRNPDVLTYS